MNIYLVLSVLLAYSCYSFAEDNKFVKATLVREIMKKLSNITFNSINKVPDKKKHFVLKKIEGKLRKTSKGLTNADKYIKLIMAEFKKKAYNKVSNIGGQPNETKSNLRSNKDHYISRAMPEPMNERTKQKLIRDIVDKIETMARGYLRESQTIEEKTKILHKIKKRIVETSKIKHEQLHKQHSNLKQYADLIAHGLDLAIRRLLRKDSRRLSAMDEDEIQTNIGDKNNHEIDMELIKKYTTLFSKIWNETSIDPKCDEQVDAICFKIASLPKLACGDGKIIFVDQLCDGVSDCWNAADETNCSQQALEKLREAITVMKEVDQSITNKCMQPLVGGAVLSDQNQVLRDVLETQIAHLQKDTFTKTTKSHLEEQLNTRLEEVEDKVYIRTSISDATATINQLSYAFDDNLCPSRVAEFRAINLQKVNDIHNKISQSLKSCVCKDDHCKSNDCDAPCKHVCWQKYSLSHWDCKSVTGGTSVSLDLICDGKFDCFDESDETACRRDPSSRFEANVVYKDVIDKLSPKPLSVEYQHSRYKIMAMTNLVRKLQKLTTQFNTDVLNIKNVRDDFFKLLVNIYEDIMKSSNLEAIEDAYKFLMTLHDKMVQAMKLSNTGNENLIAAAGCYCKDGACALRQCSRKCNATCLAEPKLTRYPCTVNATIPLRSVCNGIKDCSNEEDEIDCKEEVCRGHHLHVLRFNLLKVKITQGSVQAALESWISKVTSAVLIAETSERPSYKTVEDTVTSLLHDLVTAYASVELTRRTSYEVPLEEFMNMSNIVLQTLKSCKRNI